MNIYELFAEMADSMDIHVIFSKRKSHTGFWFEDESQHTYDFWIVEDGEIHTEIQGRSEILRPGDLFMIYPNVPYHAYSITESCTFIYTHFSARMDQNNRPLLPFDLMGRTPGDKIAAEIEVFLRSYEEYFKGTSTFGLKGPLLLLLYRIAYLRANSDKQSIEDTSKATHTALHVLLEYISEHLDQPLNIATLAQKIHMSEKYFITFFKNQLNITPHSYIVMKKMMRAYRMLQENTSIKQVAVTLGYADSFIFSKAFKNYYGFPPSRVKTDGMM